MAHTGAVTAIALAMLLATTAGFADIYRWVDEDGVTQYGDYPPAGVEAKRIDADAGIADPVEQADDDVADERSGADEASEQAAADDGPRTVEEFCSRVRDQLELVESDRDVRIETEGGELEPLEGERRAERREALRAQLAQACE